MNQAAKKVPALASAKVEGKARVCLFEQNGKNGIFFGGYVDGAKVTANIVGGGTTKDGVIYKSFLSISKEGAKDASGNVATGHAINSIKGKATPVGNVRRILVTIAGEDKATSLFVTKALSDDAFAALGFTGSREVIKKAKAAE